MKRTVCRLCGREIYLVRDPKGNEQELDASAPTFMVDYGLGLEDVEVAAPCPAFVHHDSVCRGLAIEGGGRRAG